VIPAFLTGIGGKLLAVLGIVAVLGGGVWRLWADAEDIGQLKADNDQLAATNKANAGELAKIRADMAKAQAALEAKITFQSWAAQQQIELNKVIANAKPEDRGAVPGVITGVIDGLYQTGTGGADQRGAAGSARRAP